MKRNYLGLLVGVLCIGINSNVTHAQVNQSYIETHYSTHLLSEKLVAPQKFYPVPQGRSNYWFDSIPAAMRQSYISLGENNLGKPWQSLPTSVFSEYRTNGNRVNFEGLSFAKRKQLACLAMAEVMEGKGRFLPDIINGIQSICEESWWGIPAHYGAKVPVPEDQTVDLFNAETAGFLAWTTYILRPQLDSFSPLIAKRVDSEIERRLLVPALEGKYWWKTAGMNWNPWICSNWLACILFNETNRERQLQGVSAVMKCMDAFMDAYPADGGCDEGPHYWDRAAASLSENLIMLRQATQGAIDLSTSQKIKNMASFIYKTYVGQGYAVNFADASNKALAEINVIYPFACYVNDPVMRQYAAYVADKNQFSINPAELYVHSGNYPALGRELRLLSNLHSFANEQPKDALIANSWLPNLQVMTARSKFGTTQGFYLAAKGGNNGESHNHNDVGSFIVYYNADPLLIDVGVGTYTSKTFGGDRYQIWTMQSGYHNLPKINGVDQKEGKQFCASRVQYTKKGKQITFSLDIAKAYPPEAKVDTWLRTFHYNSGKEIEITETYSLLECPSKPTELIFMTSCKPTLSVNAKSIKFIHSSGIRTLSFDSSLLSPSIEPILIDDARLLQSWPSGKLWRIHLLLKNKSVKGTLKTIIR